MNKYDVSHSALVYALTNLRGLVNPNLLLQAIGNDTNADLADNIIALSDDILKQSYALKLCAAKNIAIKNSVRVLCNAISVDAALSHDETLFMVSGNRKTYCLFSTTSARAGIAIFVYHNGETIRLNRRALKKLLVATFPRKEDVLAQILGDYE